MKYLMLLSGGVKKDYNYPRYGNDLSFAYEIFMYKFLFDRCDIFFGNGAVKLDCQGRSIDTKFANMFNIDSYFRRISQYIDENDLFVLLVSNHGILCENEGYIQLYDEFRPGISFSKLADYLSLLNCKKVIILGECHSGGILDYSISNSIIVTACSKYEKSHVSAKEYQITYSYRGLVERRGMLFDEFLVHFLSYLNGKYPDGALIASSSSSIVDAFQYALRKDKWAKDSPNPDAQEHPQIKKNIDDIIL